MKEEKAEGAKKRDKSSATFKKLNKTSVLYALSCRRPLPVTPVNFGQDQWCRNTIKETALDGQSGLRNAFPTTPGTNKAIWVMGGCGGLPSTSTHAHVFPCFACQSVLIKPSAMCRSDQAHGCEGLQQMRQQLSLRWSAMIFSVQGPQETAAHLGFSDPQHNSRND